VEPSEKVTKYVHENVSTMLRAGQARFDDEQGYWHVPVLSDVGKRAVVLGTYVLDRKLHFVRNPVKQIMDRLTDQLSGENIGGGDQEGATGPGESELGETVSAPKPLEEHAQEISLVDQLTGLATPAAFLIRLDQELERLERYKMPFCVAFVDLEDLWAVNLTHGPLVADALVAQVAKVIEGLLRGSDVAAHWAGARFALLMQGSKEEVLVGAERVLGGIQAFQPVVRKGDPPLALSAYLGGTSCPRSDPDAETTPPALIKEARGVLMATKASEDKRIMFS
jgi:diguanylate cyclase (GGDEF)-like protein